MFMWNLIPEIEILLGRKYGEFFPKIPKFHLEIFDFSFSKNINKVSQNMNKTVSFKPGAKLWKPCIKFEY